MNSMCIQTHPAAVAACPVVLPTALLGTGVPAVVRFRSDVDVVGTAVAAPPPRGAPV